MRIEFRFRILGMLGRDTIPGSPEIDGTLQTCLY
jgi:hypothetical protein